MNAPPVPELLASNNPLPIALLWGAAASYAVAAFAVAAGRPRAARAVLVAGIAAHVATLVLRGIAIGFFPLTTKSESFSAAALGLALVTAIAWWPTRTYLLPLLAAAVTAAGVSLSMPQDLRWPPPLMRTIWYPLHVPISFVAYATWAAAAAAALAWLRRRDAVWIGRIDRLALWGFGLWTLSMLFGGIWGVVSWGAYFLWDPKVVWSAILWFHYAAFVHVRLTPSMRGRGWPRPALAAAGFLFVLVAYVGTSFLFSGSSHAF